MSATTIRGSSPVQAIYAGDYPLAQRGVMIGFPNAGPQHTLGYWQSDNAVDIAVPVGTDVVAVSDGIVHASGAWSVPYSLASQSSGWEVPLFGDGGNNYFYQGLSQRLVSDGQHVTQGQVIGKSGGAGGVACLHVAIQPFPVNQVPNPNFERDTVGAAPAGWDAVAASWKVANNWAASGAQSVRVVTPTNTTSETIAQVSAPTPVPGRSFNGWPITPGQQVAASAVVSCNSQTSNFSPRVILQYYDAIGNYLGISNGSVLASPWTASVGATHVIQAIDVAPATTAFVIFAISIAPLTIGTADFNIDNVGLFFPLTPSLVVPPGASENQPTNPQTRWR